MPISRSARIGCLAALCAIACHRHPAPPSSSRVTPEPVLRDPAKAVAVHDLRDSLAAARAAIAQHQSPVYAADKLALAARQLDGESDAGVMAMLAEAETVYGHDAPVAWADAKVKDAEAHADKRADDCATAREMLARVSGKYKEEAAVLDVAKRVKAICPKVRDRTARAPSSSSSSYSGGGASSANSRAAQQGECRRRCDDAAFDCRARCQYCGTCVTDKTW